jgi:integrase
VARGKKRRAVYGQGGIHRRPDGRLEVYLGDRRTTLRKDTPDHEGYRLLNRWRIERDDERVPPQEARSMTVGKYLDAWLRSIRGTVARHTYRDYESKVRLHLKPHIGHIKLRQLGASDLRRLYGDLSQTLSPRSVEYVHTTISKALNQAEAWDYVTRNVARHAKPPQKQHSERRVLSAEQVKTFFEVAKDDRFYALYLLALTTGLRRGELLGLKWRDINFDRGTLRVQRSLDDSQSPPQEKAPKREASRRQVNLLPEVQDALEAHRDALAVLSERTWNWQDNGYVFPSLRGTPMSGDNLRNRNLRPLLERAGLPPLTFHELRHSFATLMLSQKEHPKVVSAILGHASIVQTMDTYSHVIEDIQGDAAERLRGHLFDPE